MISDETLLEIIDTCAQIDAMTGEVGVKALGGLAQHTLDMHIGIRRLAEFVPYDSELRQEMLKLIGAEMIDPPLKETLSLIKKQAMRDHPYEGYGDEHCKHWYSPNSTNGITFSHQCGYPRDLHPMEGQ